jgi:polar amino acid transport system ATP-binding protein
VTLALTNIKKMSLVEANAIASQVLQQVGMAEKLEAYPELLSGGQQQRVAIARSLAMMPELILFDEVTSALDPELTGEVLRTMENLASEGMTMALVTHEMAFAKKVADVLVFMHAGKVWEIGSPKELFANPKTEELNRFINSEIK